MKQLCSDFKGENHRLRSEAFAGHTECIEILMRKRRHKKKQVTIALVAAVCHKRLQSVKSLIRFGADVNGIQEESVFYNKKVTALCEAVMRGSMEMVEALIGAGADVNLAPPGCGSPLKIAIAHDSYDVARVLVKAGADVNGDKHILLRLAEERPKVFNELLTEAVDVNMLISTNVFLDLVEKGFTECLRVLLEKGYEIYRFKFNGFNALTNYISKASKVEKTMVMLLFAAGEDVTCQKPILPFFLGRTSIFKPQYLKAIENDWSLRASCRQKIRKHLLDINRHGNLFCRIPRLGLPSLLSRYLLYYVSL